MEKSIGNLCDSKVPIKLKCKFYGTTICPIIIYGSECLALKGKHERKTRVT